VLEDVAVGVGVATADRVGTGVVESERDASGDASLGAEVVAGDVVGAAGAELLALGSGVRVGLGFGDFVGAGSASAMTSAHPRAG
jgi:hypothetical protein